MHTWRLRMHTCYKHGSDVSDFSDVSNVSDVSDVAVSSALMRHGPTGGNVGLF